MVSIKLDKLYDGYNYKKLCMYYYDEANKEWVYIGGKYNKNKNEIYVYIDHLTNFAIIEKGYKKKNNI